MKYELNTSEKLLLNRLLKVYNDNNKGLYFNKEEIENDISLYISMYLKNKSEEVTQ